MDPAIPISIVIQMPPGSLPGMRNFATAPTTNPMISVQSKLSICVLLILRNFDLLRIASFEKGNHFAVFAREFQMIAVDFPSANQFQRSKKALFLIHAVRARHPRCGESAESQ